VSIQCHNGNQHKGLICDVSIKKVQRHNVECRVHAECRGVITIYLNLEQKMLIYAKNDNISSYREY
jgi:Zn-finger nucleic acid-binding protein